MRRFLVAATVTLLAVLQVAMAGVDRQEAIDMMKKCQKETGSPEDVEELFDSQKIPESREGKCMMACVARAKGLMRGDEIDIKTGTEFFERTYADDPEQLEKGAAIIGKCSTVDVSGMDGCDKAAAYAKCGQENGFRI
uniref:Odorant-binding protein 41 n=1 Tax=Matsumurasca onukii TaxID=2912585 RepID=A0A343WGX1_MATON|nr:odorant-binding protein 41 [Matsumurasca onukii]